MIQEQQWLLSLGTFLPLAGVLVMLFIPKKDEATAKGVADKAKLVKCTATTTAVVKNPGNGGGSGTTANSMRGGGRSVNWLDRSGFRSSRVISKSSMTRDGSVR